MQRIFSTPRNWTAVNMFLDGIISFFKAEASIYPEESLSQCEAKVVSGAWEESHMKLQSQNVILMDQEQKKIMLLDGLKLVQKKRRLC